MLPLENARTLSFGWGFADGVHVGGAAIQQGVVSGGLDVVGSPGDGQPQFIPQSSEELAWGCWTAWWVGI